MILLNGDGRSNFHTHTCYCDGNDKPEIIVEKAVELGFSTLGFSGHEYSVNDEDFCMSKENTLKYREEILALKEKYKDKIEILLGIERDYFGQIDPYPYDYVIGSCHYVEKDGELICVENTAEIMEKGVKKVFDGDYVAYVKRYYEIIRDIVKKTKADIVGHFDIITKFNEGNIYFDENALWYKEAALDALEEIAKSNPIIEINTGAMAKGYRSRPYPANFLIDRMNELNCRVILSSDCHEYKNLSYGFDEIMNRL